MAMIVARSINNFLQALVLIFLHIALFVLAVIALFNGDFTMFVVLASINYILTYTAVTGLTVRIDALSKEAKEYQATHSA